MFNSASFVSNLGSTGLDVFIPLRQGGAARHGEVLMAWFFRFG